MSLALLAAVFLAGVWMGVAVSLSFALLASIAVLAAGASWIFRGQFASLPLLAFAVLMVGIGRAPHAASQGKPSDIGYYNGMQVEVDGVVSEEPDIRDTGIDYVITVHDVVVAARTRVVSGKVQVRAARGQDLSYADGVMLRGRLVAPKNGSVPYRDILARRGISSLMRFPAIRDSGPSDAGPLGWIVRLRAQLEAEMNRWLPEPEAALLIAITLGARSASLGDISPLLVATGLIHIIAISGIKVALVAGTLNEAARRLQSRVLALLASLLALWGYVLLTGSTVSGERSAIMWTMVFVATYLGRGTVAILSLSVTGAVMVALDPPVLWDVAFLLSTVGTLAIVAFTSPLLTAFRYIPSPLRESLCVTLAAQIGTLPIVIVGFHVVSLTGPVANALVLPLLPALILLGFLLGSIGAVAWIAAPVAALAFALLHGVVLLVTHLSALPGSVPFSSASAGLACVYYVLLAAVAIHLLGRVHWTPVGRWHGTGNEIFLTLSVGAALVTAPVARIQGDGRPQLLSLGSGHSFLVRSGGRTALIDGSARPYQLLERLGEALPYGQRVIDVVIVTDPRPANVEALRAVLAHYRVGEVLDVGCEYPSATYSQWRHDLRIGKIPAFLLQTRATVVVGGVAITAVGPDALSSRPEDSAGMLRITLPGTAVLLVGIASTRQQSEALFRSVPLRADVLVVDGRNGYSTTFIRAVHPYLLYTDGRPVQGLRTLSRSASSEVIAQ